MEFRIGVNLGDVFVLDTGDFIGGKGKVAISIMVLSGEMRRPISFRASLWNTLMKIGIDVPFSIRESCGLHPQI
jgi:hypothetical protein